jgi:CheY-like chemotaxis protein
MKFLILEDDFERINWFLSRISPHRVMVCFTADEAIQKLKSEQFDVIFLDHDLCNDHYSYVGVPIDVNFEKFCKDNLDSTTGMAVAQWLSENPNKSQNAQIVIHTMNAVAQKRMASKLQVRKPLICPFDYMRRKGFPFPIQVK